MEPEEEPGGAAVREVYEEVTKTKQKYPAAFCCCYLQMGIEEEERNLPPFIKDLTKISTVVKFKELQFYVLELGHSVAR